MASRLVTCDINRIHRINQIKVAQIRIDQENNMKKGLKDHYKTKEGDLLLEAPVILYLLKIQIRNKFEKTYFNTIKYLFTIIFCRLNSFILIDIIKI